MYKRLHALVMSIIALATIGATTAPSPTTKPAEPLRFVVLAAQVPAIYKTATPTDSDKVKQGREAWYLTRTKGRKVRATLATNEVRGELQPDGKVIWNMSAKFSPEISFSVELPDRLKQGDRDADSITVVGTIYKVLTRESDYRVYLSDVEVVSAN